MKIIHLFVFLLFPPLCFSALKQDYYAVMFFGENDIIKINSGFIVVFEIINDQYYNFLNGQIILQIEDTNPSSCYLLFISYQYIPSYYVFEDVEINENVRSTIDIDIDGLTSCSKTLSVKFQSISNDRIYAYLLGPYQFGASSVTLIPSTSYNIHYYLNQETNCLNNCSNRGFCTFNGTCICQEGYISRDCSIKAVFWNSASNNEESLFLTQGDKKYFAIDFSKEGNLIDSEKISFKLMATGGIAYFFFALSYQGKGIPDYYYWKFNSHNEIINMYSIHEEETLLVLMNQEIQEYIQTNITLILMFVTNSPFTILNYKVDFGLDNSSLSNGLLALFIILGIIFFIILFYLIKTKCKTYLGKRLRNQIQQEYLPAIERQGRNHSQQIGSQINNNRNINQNRIIPIPQQNFENLKQLINTFMPAKKLDNKLKEELKGESCAVCLEDFATCQESVRLTICYHLFHSECLITWMQQQKNCPFCRQELTLEILRSNLKNRSKVNGNLKLKKIPFSMKRKILLDNLN